MSAVDIILGLLAGVVSCLTPELLLLFPLLIGAAGAAGRSGIVALAVGLGLAMVLTGALAGSFGTPFVLDAIWTRRFVCSLLVLQGFALTSGSLVARYPRLTGGEPALDAAPAAMFSGVTFRKLLLALLVGANWVPVPGPILGRASLMAAGGQSPALGYGILFVFGIGAALPWIVIGRIVRLLAQPMMPGLTTSLMGKRILGLTLLIVAVIGISGRDAVAARWLDSKLPEWTRKLTTEF